jgi:hypothetical protein
MLALYKATHKPEYLQSGERMLDYLLLTQQVWPTPMFLPNLLGGFTTQNTDAEWSDARESYAATLLFDFYRATGNMEYLERAVAAARSGFAVAPWENWAHTGFLDEPGALTGFHWGTGSAMTSIELMSPALGDAFIDARARAGVGFDESTITDVRIDGDSIRFHLDAADTTRTYLVRFAGLDASRTYRVQCNNTAPVSLSGSTLLREGITVGPLQPSS